MTTVGSFEAKTHLPQLLERVSRGERITITKHGRPVARLVPPAAEHRPEVAQIIASLREARRGVRLEGATIRELIEEGRR